MSSIKSYIENLDFDYIKTYSGYRGELFENLKTENEEKIEELDFDIKFAGKSNIEQSEMIMEKLRLTKELSTIRPLIQTDGTIHKSAIEINSQIPKNDSYIQNLFEALLLPPIDVVRSRCIPIFRDVIVFYSKENLIVGILNLCFECIEIENEKGEKFDLDQKSYWMLKNILRGIGHPTEN